MSPAQRAAARLGELPRAEAFPDGDQHGWRVSLAGEVLFHVRLSRGWWVAAEVPYHSPRGLPDQALDDGLRWATADLPEYAGGWSHALRRDVRRPPPRPVRR